MPCSKHIKREELIASNPLKIIEASSKQAQKIFENIECIYTDIDGTMFAPGGRALVTHDGEPSCALPQALIALKNAGVKVILCSGRRANPLSEFARMFELEGYIAELGGIRGGGVGSEQFQEYTFDSSMIPNGMTPHDYIENLGIVKELFERFPGKLEYHTPWHTDRTIAPMLRGMINIEEANDILAKSPLPLELLDNGEVHPREHNLKGLDHIRCYHLIPKGVNKGSAVRYDMKVRGLDPSKTIAFGDSESDILMGEGLVAYVCSVNGLNSQDCCNALLAREGITILPYCCTIDGWVEVANAIAKAKA